MTLFIIAVLLSIFFGPFIVPMLLPGKLVTRIAVKLYKANKLEKWAFLFGKVYKSYSLKVGSRNPNFRFFRDRVYEIWFESDHNSWLKTEIFDDIYPTQSVRMFSEWTRNPLVRGREIKYIKTLCIRRVPCASMFNLLLEVKL
ncbi:hypothetical protein A3K34_02095 [candidate division WWE3 bacterium RIFOXYC1_FULL_40_10]|uniref:Uncharacterized protein n=1 Tax=candidate division WWE3 bacterium RIFOXYA2_FULL_46_9 TaxID=1802636 RepID=A0A1F4VZN9_UNCKA|nr:MAG: hypothetical protein A3K58_02095 [candidate division WWE3 bacterium RIFOXYB1_FULL_40_22]OGC61646.1 MAG: hypothetical protein A3K37_02095 [candidate division WWE3 bacterium RIFOXYA1_FULL_40_11]OGC62649.1 MAG: hypothetical protein A2264_02120 [candidate division WWE3 bacterium RIFOXYA2_FULL_46_9]OGC64403.1 MAG: hypothetical protein A2326_02550 [candidate division WWE3 bacterium RIFOXYB2_FULL_41_6]OGC66029.1 MAG: hypothetical protein A3K34_02095 [candidate division WWE3 bacterium RIFOXYC1_